MMNGRPKPIARIHIKMVIAALAMFVFASLDVSVHLRHNLDVFVYREGDPVEEFSKTSNWISVISMGCYVAQTFVGDSILVSLPTSIFGLCSEKNPSCTGVGSSGAAIG